MKGKVMILEDDPILAQQISKVLKQHDYSVLHSTNSDTFFGELRGFMPDVILLDVFLVGSRLNGLQVLRYLKENLDFNYKIIIISGEIKNEQLNEIRGLGAYHFIEKGAYFSTNQLLLHIDNAVTLKRQEEENLDLQIEYLNLKKQFTRSFPFIGESPAINKIRTQLARLSEADEDILILGETGTGKEVAANYYYLNSKRFGKPFHTVNCSSLTENLIESELFGLARGTTAGEKGNIGLFERCSEGLLFLDEVTNLTLQAQAKILRSIENKEIQVVGGALKTVNTRLIFASNAEMRTLASSPKFRPDLFYRIEGNIVELPPLRERNNDILLLMSHFFTNYANRYSFSDQLDLRELKSDLLEYHWPGNVRELKNFCKHIILNEKEITNRNVLKHLRTKMQNRPEYSAKGMDRYLSIRNIKDSTAAFERDYILYYLQENNWHVSKTAKEMGIERTTLYKKMKALDIAQNQGEA
ncbi:MAG TPA: sigma-54 dependent transcriptional regulator [Candidatus Cloacimonadota bacterium]|nr:sigma-54 dependent transcriptional regulator [Candidatus Cloacimonadota bacterium]HQH50688.1 sigma-54 dependent transcriptional regulator [Candidatus Cloacimonadota bacterium]